MTAAGWCGPDRAVTPAPWGGSSTPSGRRPVRADHPRFGGYGRLDRRRGGLRCPTAFRRADPFHAVAWAIDAVDVERRRA